MAVASRGGSSCTFAGTLGPFEVQTFTHDRAVPHKESFKYTLTIQGFDGDRTIRCSYSCCERLRASMAAKLFNGELPPMPPKSILRKRLSRSFMEARTGALEELLRAIIDADPFAERLCFRRFLGLPLQASNESCESLISTTLFSTITTIREESQEDVENEEDTDDSDVDFDVDCDRPGYNM